MYALTILSLVMVSDLGLYTFEMKMVEKKQEILTRTHENQFNIDSLDRVYHLIQIEVYFGRSGKIVTRYRFRIEA